MYYKKLLEIKGHTIIFYNDWSEYGRDQFSLFHIGRFFLNRWRYEFSIFGFALVYYKFDYKPAKKRAYGKSI